MRTPYTYLIGWPEYDKWYYGVRFAKGCHPNELWITYFTSSDYVKEFIANFGQPTIKQVRVVFGEGDDKVEIAREYEHRVLRRLRVRYDDRWINMTDNKSWPIISGENHSSKRPEVREKISKQTKLTTPKGDDHPRRKDPSRWANANTIEVNQQRREKVISSEKSFKSGQKHLEASCIHCRITLPLGHLFRWHGDNCKKNSNKLNVKVTCPHCKFTGSFNMTQYHFDNCKYNEKNTNLERYDALSSSNKKRIENGSHNFVGKNSYNYIRVSCFGCRKETNVPGLGFHKFCITGDPTDKVTHKHKNKKQ